MSDERRGEGSGASAAIVVVLVALALLGLLVVGGGAAFAFFRMSSLRQVEMMEARAQAEMMALQMHKEKAAMEVQLAQISVDEKAQQDAAAARTKGATNPHEVLLEIDAAGRYKLAGKSLEYYEDLKAALFAEHETWGQNLQVVISADKEAKAGFLTKAVEAAECSGITRHRILTATSAPPAAAEPAPSN